MGIWRRLVSAIRAPFQFSAESAPRPIDQVILDMSGRVSGRRVSREVALSVPAVQRGRNLICSVATLPLVQRGPDNTPRRLSLLEQIDPDVANVVTLAQTLEDLLFESIAWWEITAQDAQGYPTSARRRDPAGVSMNPPNDGRTPAPLPSGHDPRGAVLWMDGVPVPWSRVIRFDSPNPAVLSAGARAIRRAILLDAAAAMYAEDPRPQDYFTPADGAEEVDDDEVRDILAEWKAARKKRATAWVPRSMKYNAVDSPSPQQLQLVELQRQVTIELSNALGVDPEELGVSTTSRTYANVIDRRRDRINDVLAPFMQAISQRLSMGDVTRRGYRVDFDLDDYLRANPTERWNVYKVAFDMVDDDGRRAISLDEIREEERWPALPPAERPAPAPSPVIDPEGTDVDQQTVDASRAAMYAQLRADGLRLNADGDDRLHFADVPVQQFTVDTRRRTIEGLALPYGVVAKKYGLKFRFVRGALRWTSVNRVKLLRDHDMSQPLGVATNITETAAGVRVRFKVARGPAGDEALALAEDGVLDGLSVGVDFDAAVDATMADDGVMDVHRADWRETSLTPMPAFDDARVTKVAASRTEGNPMEECATCGTRHAPGVACTPAPQPTNQPEPAGLNLSQDQLTALLTQPGAIQALVQAQQPAPPQPATPAGGLTLSADQVQGLIRSGGLGVLLGVPQVTPAPQPEPERPTVNPTRQTTAVQASVNEPLPYRFDRDGNLTRGVQYDFSTDLVNGSKGDGEAMQRATAFLLAMRPVFERATAAQFDVDSTDVAGLNPTRQRPDMYVDQRDFSYPIWEAISKGTLTDQVPFVLPKFATATGLVAAHTEGVEPTPGTFTATSQTITPTANSGKVEITREAWDAGGNPQLSGIIWRQMTKAWFEGLEAAAVAMLDALSPTQITLSTAAQDDTLVGELESAIAALQFIRGGMSMRDLFLQVDLYKALIAAVDADGRKLLPLLGAVNANGQVSELFADLSIAGLRGRPAWALAASGTVAASSYLFDRSTVHGWASAPQRLEFQYRVAYVDVAIWGYKATANTDLTGVREIVYDPQ